MKSLEYEKDSAGKHAVAQTQKCMKVKAVFDIIKTFRTLCRCNNFCRYINISLSMCRKLTYFTAGFVPHQLLTSGEDGVG